MKKNSSLLPGTGSLPQTDEATALGSRLIVRQLLQTWRAWIITKLYAEFPWLAEDSDAACDVIVHMEDSVVRTRERGGLVTLPENPKAFLLTRMRRSARDLVRKIERDGRLRATLEQLDPRLDENQPVMTITDEEAMEERRMIVLQYLPLLPKPCQKLIKEQMADVEADDDDLAIRLGWTRRTVQSIRSNAIAAIRKLMASEAYGKLFN